MHTYKVLKTIMLLLLTYTCKLQLKRACVGRLAWIKDLMFMLYITSSLLLNTLVL